VLLYKNMKEFRQNIVEKHSTHNAKYEPKKFWF